jgi:hypothetical protein
MRRRLLALAFFFAACRCAPDDGLPTTPGDGAPETSVVEALKDPYDGLAARGTVTSSERAARVLEAAGGQFGCGPEAAASMRRHAAEAWAGRVALFLDHGGDDQVKAAWLDLYTSALQSTRVGSATKLQVRQAQARVAAELNEGRSSRHMRRRYLAEVAWLMTIIDRDYSRAAQP